MTVPCILVIEDDPDIRELIQASLAGEGYRIHQAVSGEKGLAAARSLRPDLVLLDLMLPGMDGCTVCRLLREDEVTRDLPVVMVTARGEEADIVAGLELGADDYVTKPFSPRVLAARVRAVLRRGGRRGVEPPAGPVRHGSLVVDPARRDVTVAGRPVALSATEFAILLFLARRPGWVFTRRQILDGVHGEGHPVLDRSLDVQIAALRRKLGDAGALVETVRGVGYRFRES